MVARIEKVLTIHIVDQLLEHGSLQHLAQDREDCYRPVIFRFKFTALTFVQWDNLSNLPLCWKLVALDGQVEDVTHRWNNILPGQLNDVGIQVVHSRCLGVL